MVRDFMGGEMMMYITKEMLQITNKINSLGTYH